MSVLYSSKDYRIICHRKYLDELYNDPGNITHYNIKKEIFSVLEPYKNRRKNKDRTTEQNSKLSECDIENRYRDIKDTVSLILKEQYNASVPVTKVDIDNITGGINYSDEGPKTFNGGNLSNNSVLAQIGHHSFLVPPKCRFYNCDVRNISDVINEKFDVILMDPPWWNKYIRRKRKQKESDGYKMMWDAELAELEICKLLEDDGLLAIWCTNAKSHLNALINEIFPKWGVSFVAQWFWIKVTNSGEVVTPFSTENCKQPFERIIFGARRRSLPLPRDNEILISVPSAIHSHKPPLCEVLQPFLPANPKGLEIFARYLLPNWTSFGNEVMKLQNIMIFNKSLHPS